MSTSEVVTLTIDDVEVSVPKGTGLVEAAAVAGIEIPVFCYEPRLGPPVGACRMCLCEVAPGPPKPQAACTLTVAEGMVVKTAHTSEMAAESQNATLEFILVNHPLDCPVCDKGGECPLQDLTFRYGPGSTRMTFSKRTYDKPIPISPTIALDRERCILCYRCTRFSEAVSEDGQLVARNRGSQSQIATFEDRPYRAPFSGNVIELCPVGALTSTQYRFEGRPWEIQNVPTVCGLCPVGCNIAATTREGKVKRILSRNHPEVDEGWLCDKGRFGFPALRAADRVTAPLRRSSGRRFGEVSWAEALDELEARARAAGNRVVLALSGTETVETAYALSRLVREGLGAHTAILPEEASPALAAFRQPLSALRDAEAIVVIGDDPVVERAPVVDLWIRAARRLGANVVTVGPAGRVQTKPGTYPRVEGKIAEQLGDAKQVAVVWSGPGGHGGAEPAALATALGKRVFAVYHLPATANGAAVADAWHAAGEGEAEQLERIGLLIVSGDEIARDERLRELAGRADTVVAIGAFADELRPFADLVLPATSYLERDGTMVNLEGRVQRLRRAVIPPCPDELAWIARLAERFGITIASEALGVFAELSPKLFGGVSMAAVGERAVLRAPGQPEQPAAAAKAARRTKAASGGPLRLTSYRALFSGPAVERVPELRFQRPEHVAELSPRDAAVRGVENGDVVRVSSNGTSVDLRARINRRLLAGVVRAAAEHVEGLEAGVEVTKL
jgi:NADH-quinone oxidoreductase subunit G